MAPKEKVLILNEKLMEYRIPIYDLIADKFDLTYAYSAPYAGEFNGHFKLKMIRAPRKIGPVFMHPDNLLALCNQFKVAIVLGDIHKISFASLPFRRRKFKMAFWSIGVSTSNGFDVNRKMDWLRDSIYKKAEACIFYTEYARQRAIDKGYNPNAVFVANNTVKVLDSGAPMIKDSYLFIGALQKRKGLSVLLEAYKQAYVINTKLPILNIVGGGEEYGQICDWISANNLNDKIVMVGPVFDREIKRAYFKRAFACISPRQAGLSVLEAMGYGIPFVTMYNAKTGGERLNIANGETGILMKDEKDLVNILLDIAEHPGRYNEMGERAYRYYCEERRPECMAQGLIDAIDYLLSME